MVSDKKAECDAINMDDRGGRVDELADRTTGFTGQRAALGPSGLNGALLGCS